MFQFYQEYINVILLNTAYNGMKLKSWFLVILCVLVSIVV